MIIDRNVKAVEVKEKMMQSLELMDKKYSTEDSASDDEKMKSDSTEIKFGWK